MSQTSPSSRRGPRQARSAETRRKLLDAGFEAFAAKGHDGVNLVEDVLEPAGISTGSFYHQFADKTELLREILAEAAVRRRRFIVEIGAMGTEADDLETAVRSVIERLIDSLDEDTAAWRLQRVTRLSGVAGVRELGSSNRESWTRDLAGFLGRWFDNPERERRQAAVVMLTLARGFMFDYLDLPAEQREDRATVVRTTTAFVIGGLTALLGEGRRPAPPDDSH